MGAPVMFKSKTKGTSLVAQWVGIHLTMQETWLDPWSGKTSHAAGQLSPCATATEPELESPGATAREATAVRSRVPHGERPHSPQLEQPRAKQRRPAQPNK